ncbi:MAG: tRNAHis guanylyltransferase-domain-containing protein, partial [Olpidium bornovanus]
RFSCAPDVRRAALSTAEGDGRSVVARISSLGTVLRLRGTPAGSVVLAASDRLSAPPAESPRANFCPFRPAETNAKSCFDYVKMFEADDTLVQNCWIVVRVDGLDFRRRVHKFQKPNDDNALKLMNAAGEAVMLEFGEIVLAFGQSDDKIVSTIASLFTSNYVLKWPTYMPSTPLVYPPSFEGRAVLYPSDGNLRDYLSWRQADTHIKYLHSTTFWRLVLSGGMSENEAAEALSVRVKGTPACSAKR